MTATGPGRDPAFSRLLEEAASQRDMEDARGSRLAFPSAPGYVLRVRRIREVRGPDGRGCAGDCKPECRRLLAARARPVTGRLGERRAK